MKEKTPSNYYLTERELTYEIIISIGKGKLTRRGGELIFLLGKNVIRKKEYSYRTYDDRNDCLQQCYLALLRNWNKYNKDKYDSAFPYLSEIGKRGLAEGFNKLQNKKYWDPHTYKMISIDAANEGKGANWI